MSIIERLCYLAGWFDGEGCISHKGGSSWKVMGVNTDPVIIYELERMFGGHVTIRPENYNKAHKSNKIAYQWEATGGNARRFLTSVFPYLRHAKKIERAKKALAVDEASPSMGRYWRNSIASGRL